MKFRPVEPPRVFHPTGPQGPAISHVASVELADDELITLTTPTGGEIDVVRKPWGFYPLPSLNDRLPRFGLHPALVVNAAGHLYLLLVERGKRGAFTAYLESEGMTLVAWLGA